MSKNNQDPDLGQPENMNSSPDLDAIIVDNQENMQSEIHPLEIGELEPGLPEAETETSIDPEQLAIQLQEKKQELAGAKADLLRLMADFDNFRKRNARERLELIQYASNDVMKSLLPALDDFQRALVAIEKTDNLSSIRDGISMVSENFKKILEKQGLSAIESKGKVFDSSMHEAIGSFAVEEAGKKGIILEEAERGYLLNGKVIRYSKVIVGE